MARQLIEEPGPPWGKSRAEKSGRFPAALDFGKFSPPVFADVQPIRRFPPSELVIVRRLSLQHERILAFEIRRAAELQTLLGKHGGAADFIATFTEAPLEANGEALDRKSVV